MQRIIVAERSGGNIGCFEILAILRISTVTSIDAAEIILSLWNFVDKCGRKAHFRFVLCAYPRLLGSISSSRFAG
jgi:hypothetical protein